jgi:P2 family phage contractile tail tube protein
MALPRKLKNMNLYNGSESYLGQVVEVTLPKLARKMEAYRGGGMSGPIQIDMGQEALEMEWTCGGILSDVLKQYGIPQHDGVALRFVGAYQRENNAAIEALQVDIRGRHQTIEFGNAKPGEDTTFKVTSALSYYRLTLNGEVLIESDLVHLIENVGGEDRLQGIRQALGL